MDINLALLRLKNMVAWDCPPCLDETDLTALLMYCRRIDGSNRSWEDDGWTPTFDLNAAAMEAWLWKAGAAADGYKIVADTTELDRDQIHTHCVAMYNLYAKRVGSRPQSLRAQGNLVVDRGTFTAIPWWYQVSGSQ